MEKKEEKKQEIKQEMHEKKPETKKHKEELKEIIGTLQRVQADFENYKKRVEKEKQEFVKFAAEEIIARLLPILDSFELALKNTHNNEEMIKGVELIYAQLFSLLESYGVKPIKSIGERFDPYNHEALMQEDSDKPSGTILEELQKGYLLGEKVLRHAKVKVSK